MLDGTEQVSDTRLRPHWARRLLRYSITARNAAKSALVAPSHLAQDTELTQSSSFSSGGSWVASGPGLPSRSALGLSSTWILKDEYSFSSGPRLAPELKELLELMARSAEQPENGSSAWDTSTPGLLISVVECKLLKLPSGPGWLPLVVTVVAGGSRVSWKHKESFGRSSGDRKTS